MRQTPGRPVVLVLLIAVLFIVNSGSSQIALMAPTMVPCGDVASLSAAITDANADPDLSTIELADTCTYSVDTADSSDENGATGLPAITSPVVIQGNGSTVQGNGSAFRLFKVDGGGLTLNHVTIAGGTALYGGNLFSKNGTLIVTDSTIKNGSATYGAGIYAENSTITITRSIVFHNVATESGGSMMTTTSTVTIGNSTLSDNTATNQRGGGLYITGGSGSVVSSTIFANNARFGGGVDVAGSTTLTLTNVLIAGNYAGEGFAARDPHADCFVDGTLISGGHNLTGKTPTGEGTGCVLQGTGDVQVSTGSLTLGTNRVLDPNLADHGGFTQTYALASGAQNVAVDAGDDDACASTVIGDLDQRGYLRPQGAHCDIGAYERDASPAPTATPTFTSTPTPTATDTPTPTATATATSTSTSTPTATETPTQTPTSTDTPTPTETATPTETPTETSTPTVTSTPTSTATATATSTPTSTPTTLPTATDTATPTPTATSSVPAIVPAGTVTPRPTGPCDPRPNVQVLVAPAGSGILNVTLISGAGSLHAVQVGTADRPIGNAAVVAPGSPAPLANGAIVAPPPGTTTMTLQVRRLAPEQAVIVPLVAADDCGAWPTFVGGGAGAF